MDIAHVDRFLARLRYDGPRDPSIATLRALHRAHMLEVPFENLDIQLGRRIELGEEALFDKIVARRRGGFCYELNGLFASLLRALGFRVTMLEAGVFGANGFGPAFDHLALAVDLEERWLVDVGFGDSFVEPLRFDDEGEQREGARAYRVRREGERRVLEARSDTDAWEPFYALSLTPRALAEFLGMCAYHQAAPSPFFTRGRMCSRATKLGRVTLKDDRLITTENGARVEAPITGEQAFLRALEEHFGVILAPPARRSSSSA